ncbi:TPA: NUDIX domain-containing protein [Staphylococcus pseudintermedius]
MMNIDEIRPGVAAIVLNDNNKILLQKRRDVERWGIISGNIEPGESVSEAITREVKEEANLDIDIVKIIGVYSDPDSQVFTYPDGKNVHFITTCFLAHAIGEEIFCDPKESLDMAFFDTNQLPQKMLAMHPKWLEDALTNTDYAYIR